MKGHQVCRYDPRFFFEFAAGCVYRLFAILGSASGQIEDPAIYRVTILPSDQYVITADDKYCGSEWNTLVDFVVSSRAVGESNRVVEQHHSPLVDREAINSLPVTLSLRHGQIALPR